jgi:hypothetical protein
VTKIGSALLAVVCAAHPAAVSAQAQIPEAGTVDLSAQYLHFDGHDHLFSTDRVDGLTLRGYTASGSHWFLGDTFAHTLLTAADFGISDRLAVTVQAAFVWSEYEGNAPVSLSIDDGTMRGSIQDGTIGLRSPIIGRPFLLTPSVGITFPLTDYASLGHSAPGPHLFGGTLGLSAARGLGAYGGVGILESKIEVTVYEKTSDRRITRLRSEIESSLFTFNTLSLDGYAAYHTTFGGADWVSGDPSQPQVHGGASSVALETRTSAARAARLGVGCTWSGPQATSVSAMFVTTIWGQNIDDADLLIFSLSRSFTLRAATTRTGD